MAHGMHMRAYSTIPNVDIVAVCALPEDVKRFAEQWGISKTYTEIEDICNDPEIDMIDIGLPHYLHIKAAILAAEANKAVICEKPLARNAEEAVKMVSTVEKHGVFSAYLENYSFFPWAEEAKRCIEGGVLGKPAWSRFSGGSGGPYSPWFFNPEESGGGCLVDIGCHFVEVQRWLFGKKNPTQVFGWTDSMVNKQAIEGGVEDYCLAMTKYDETMCQCETSWGLIGGGEGFKLEIAGTEGVFTTGTCPTVSVFSVAEDTKPLRRGPFSVPGVEKGWFLSMRGGPRAGGAMMQHVIESYFEGKKPRHTFKDGVIVNKVIDAIYKSAKSRKWENVSV